MVKSPESTHPRNSTAMSIFQFHLKHHSLISEPTFPPEILPEITKNEYFCAVFQQLGSKCPNTQLCFSLSWSLRQSCTMSYGDCTCRELRGHKLYTNEISLRDATTESLTNRKIIQIPQFTNKSMNGNLCRRDQRWCTDSDIHHLQLSIHHIIQGRHSTEFKNEMRKKPLPYFTLKIKISQF